MKDSILLFAFALLLFSCSKNELETVPDGDLVIRIDNQAGVDLDKVLVQDLEFLNIPNESVTAYEVTNDTELRHINEFLPVVYINETPYHRGVGFCGMPPIPVYEKEGTYTIIITALNVDINTLEMIEVED